jgi:predicted ATPase
MNRFENISVRGFRRLQNIELEMRNLIVMIGANGAGKTSFLDVLSILAASASGNLQNLLQLKGGLNEILTRGKVQELEIEISMQVPDKKTPLNYSLTLSPKGLSYEVRDEYLTQQRTPNRLEPFKYIESQGLDIKYFQDGSGLVRPNWEHNPLETSLSQVPKMYREPENLRKSLASCTYYGALDVQRKVQSVYLKQCALQSCLEQAVKTSFPVFTTFGRPIETVLKWLKISFLLPFQISSGSTFLRLPQELCL